MKKKTLIILRVAGMEPIEYRKPGNWTQKQISEFVKGLKKGYPEAIVEISTVEE